MNLRSVTLFLYVVLSLWHNVIAQTAVVADAATHSVLPNASVYDRNGEALIMTDRRGRLPKIKNSSFPVTIRYIGFDDIVLAEMPRDTVFMNESVDMLDEVVVETKRHKMLHILAYVREYSTLTTYSDTVFMFREKMVDYMVSPDEKAHFKGWTIPRVLTSKSYYRFKDSSGLDSVSNRFNNYFTWSDWVGIPPTSEVPATIADDSVVNDTIRGKYSAIEVWTKDKDDNRLMVNVNVLADSTGRKWVPNLAVFFKKDVDFERFKVSFTYDDMGDSRLRAYDLQQYSYDIDSNGRLHSMFRFNRVNEPFFVSTHAEVYILDKEYITVKEARKWENRKFDIEPVDILQPMNLPEPDENVLALVERVENLNHDNIRLDFVPDQRLVSHNIPGRNFKIGQRALFMLKTLTGISAYKAHKQMKKSWNGLRKSRNKKKDD